MPRVGSMSPIIAFVRSIPGDYYTLAEVARFVNRAEGTLRDRMHKDPERFGPSTMTFFGKLPIYLYSMADIERVEQSLRAINRDYPQGWQGPLGRPTLWTEKEKHNRVQRLRKVTYLRRQARKFETKGDDVKARQHRSRAAQIAAKLKKQELERRETCRTRNGVN